ncbi:hypothetical protein COY95_02045, partial [Candidatus Woesearchaeota archaeon CG_4_10_14_0_8_um_filter_47_5]
HGLELPDLPEHIFNKKQPQKTSPATSANSLQKNPILHPPQGILSSPPPGYSHPSEHSSNLSAAGSLPDNNKKTFPELAQEISSAPKEHPGMHKNKLAYLESLFSSSSKTPSRTSHAPLLHNQSATEASVSPEVPNTAEIGSDETKLEKLLQPKKQKPLPLPLPPPPSKGHGAEIMIQHSTSGEQKPKETNQPGYHESPQDMPFAQAPITAIHKIMITSQPFEAPSSGGDSSGGELSALLRNEEKAQVSKALDLGSQPSLSLPLPKQDAAQEHDVVPETGAHETIISQGAEVTTRDSADSPQTFQTEDSPNSPLPAPPSSKPLTPLPLTLASSSSVTPASQPETLPVPQEEKEVAQDTPSKETHEAVSQEAASQEDTSSPGPSDNGVFGSLTLYPEEPEQEE